MIPRKDPLLGALRPRRDQEHSRSLQPLRGCRTPYVVEGAEPPARRYAVAFFSDVTVANQWKRTITLHTFANCNAELRITSWRLDRPDQQAQYIRISAGEAKAFVDAFARLDDESFRGRHPAGEVTGGWHVVAVRAEGRDGAIHLQRLDRRGREQGAPRVLFGRELEGLRRACEALAAT